MYVYVVIMTCLFMAWLKLHNAVEWQQIGIDTTTCILMHMYLRNHWIKHYSVQLN